MLQCAGLYDDMSGAAGNAVIIEVSHAVMDVPDIDDRHGDAIPNDICGGGYVAMAIKFSVLLFNVNSFISQNCVK